MIDKDIEIEIEIYTEYFWGDEISKGNKKGRKEQYQEAGVREVKINTRKKNVYLGFIYSEVSNNHRNRSFLEMWIWKSGQD